MATIKLTYRGDLGSGELAFDLSEGMIFKDLIQVFHEKTGLPDSYTIYGGAPPNRRPMSVSYDYYLLLGEQEYGDWEQDLASLNLAQAKDLVLEIGGGGKVD